MRIERWYWLIVFCLVSAGIHVAVALRGPSYAPPPVPIQQNDIQVSIDPLPAEKPAEKPKPVVKPLVRPHVVAKIAPHVKVSPSPAVHHAPAVVKTAATRKLAVEPKHVEKQPIPQPTVAERIAGGLEKIKDERPVALGSPSAAHTTTPKFASAHPDFHPGGGGAPAAGPVPGGHGGMRGPEAPPDEVVFNGGGAGGIKLPKEAPAIGGGGGRSILSVDNPLAKEVIPDDRPGLTVGKGGGQGSGAGPGAGFSRGHGIGTSLAGTHPLAAINTKPGSGIGAGSGKGLGTRSPGGGHGTGSDLPGTGGTGTGYSRGHGIGVGTGSGAGVGNGAGSLAGTGRGIPFGDISGLLTSNGAGGGKGGGPGGPGRGAVFGPSPLPGGNGAVHIVYVLDVSGSMAEGNKIGKAKEALKKALRELHPTDTFDVIAFNSRAYPLALYMIPAQPDLVAEAMKFVDNMTLGNHTNISGAMDLALELDDISHIFLMSDGEPEGRNTIRDTTELRQFIKERNIHKAHILCMGLCLGERYPGEELMKGIAADNEGTYSYIDLSKEH